MDANARAQLSSILSDLREVSRQMNNAAAQLQDMRGVGTELCADRLEVLADKYDAARRHLSNID